jgi:mRNA interferase MazF
MIAKVRPALVVSTPFSDIDRALVTLVPHTTSARHSRFQVTVALPFLRPGAFDVQSIVTIPQVKLLRRLGRLSAQQLAPVERVLADWLGLAPPTTGPDYHGCQRRTSLANHGSAIWLAREDRRHSAR